MASLRLGVAFASTTFASSPTWVYTTSLTGVNVTGATVDRGRRTEFEKTGPGSATVSMIDKSGILDPTNAAGTYYGQLVPKKQAKIELRNPVLNTWHTIFKGYVEDWAFTLDVAGEFIRVELQLVDGLALLSDAELMVGDGDATPPGVDAGNVFYEDTAGSVDDRINAILDDVSWPAGARSIFTGNVRVREKVYSPGTSALQALADAADAEFPGLANVYCAKNGDLTFHGRLARFNPTDPTYGINEYDVGDRTLWGSDASAVPISALGWHVGSEALINAALAYPEGILDADIDGQWDTDGTSITAYGRSTVTFENLQTSYDILNAETANPATKRFATHYKANYNTPTPRVSQLVFRSRWHPQENVGPLWLLLCLLEISDVCNLTTAHVGGGGFANVGFFVEGLHYQITPLSNDLADVTLTADVSPQALYVHNSFT